VRHQAVLERAMKDRAVVWPVARQLHEVRRLIRRALRREIDHERPGRGVDDGLFRRGLRVQGEAFSLASATLKGSPYNDRYDDQGNDALHELMTSARR